MKLYQNNVMYVQRKDIASLISSDIEIPGSIFARTFGMCEASCVDSTNRNDYIKFYETDEIDFFNSLDWIIDYNDIKDFDENQLIELGESIANKRKNIAITFNKMDEHDKAANADMIVQCELLDYKLASLSELIWTKRNKQSLKLPNGVDCKVQNKEKKIVLKKILNKIIKKDL